MAVDIPNTRQRLLDAAVELLDQRGYHGTGLNEIFELSDTSRGSFYHHFPGGKQDLATAAIKQVGAQLGEALEQILQSAPTPAVAVATFAGLLGEQLLASEFRKGCPIAALAAEATTLPPLVREAVAGIYASWTQQIAGLLARQGVSDERAINLATAAVAAMEGALLLSRAIGSLKPLSSTADLIGASLNR